jgi:hypothetical protein
MLPGWENATLFRTSRIFSFYKSRLSTGTHEESSFSALHIQVHEVQGPNTEASQFFIFYPGGSTVFAEGVEQLQQRLAAGYNR